MIQFETAADFITAINETEDPKEVVRLWNQASMKSGDRNDNHKLVIEIHQVCGGKVLKAIQDLPDADLADLNK